MKLCINCKYFRHHECTRKGYALTTNPVTGKPAFFYEHRLCAAERSSTGHKNKFLNVDRCGEEGKYFEAMPEPNTWLGRIFTKAGLWLDSISP